MEEAWKGEPSASNVQLSLQGGVDGYRTNNGFAFLGGAAFKAIPNGLLDDVNEVGFFEVQLGHTFLDGGDPWPYSVHFRWDFQRNIDWTFYALGGLGGHFGDVHAFDADWAVHPRFGIGTLWSPFVENMSIRAEVAADRATAGVQFSF